VACVLPFDSASVLLTLIETFMDLRPLDDLAKKLAASVPEGLTHLRVDLEKNFRAVLQSGLAKLDLVTRQEFDVQAGVLKRTREKLEQLEARLAELEGNQPPGSIKKN
jgi:BMFP domain-containing protein YqiC